MRPIRIPGYKVKDGKVEKSQGRMSVSARIKAKKSKRVRPVRRTG